MPRFDKQAMLQHRRNLQPALWAALLLLTCGIRCGAARAVDPPAAAAATGAVPATAAAAPPRYTAERIFLPFPQTAGGRMFQGLGFLRNGDPVIWEAIGRTKLFILHEGTVRTVAIPWVPVAPEVTNDGELQQFEQNSAGRWAIFRYRDDKWIQVSPLLAHFCDSYVQNADGLGAATARTATGPDKVILWRDGKWIDLNSVLKRDFGSALAVAADGAILMCASQSGASHYFWWRDGKVIQNVRLPSRWISLFHLTSQKQFIVEETGNHYQSLRSILIDGEQSRVLHGPKDVLHDAHLGADHWFCGSEYPPDWPDGHTDKRAVVIANETPYYLDELIDNEDELKQKYRSDGKFNTAYAISQDGRILTTGRVYYPDGSSAFEAFLLTPVKN